MEAQEIQRAICGEICRRDGIRAREIARALDLDHQTVNHELYSSPLMKELCWQDRDYRWHGIVRQERPHVGLQEFAGYYSAVGEFLDLDERAWLARLTEGFEKPISDATSTERTAPIRCLSIRIVSRYISPDSSMSFSSFG